jgi:drug/metabolite transporter (DMT)-like permease
MTSAFDPYIGPAAGVSASLLWTFTSLLFTGASRRLGVALVNALRIFFALVWLALMHRLLVGTWIPAATAPQVVLLGISGLMGLSLGDWALFAAFVSIGPRLSSLICTTAPILAALFGWLALDETLNALAWLGMLLTIAGVAWVVLERPASDSTLVKSHRVRGVLLALVAASCQAGGYLLSKEGIGHGWLPREQHMPPQTAALIRMFFAAIFVSPVFLWLAARNRTNVAPNPSSAAPRRLRTGYLFTLAGSFVGPFLGMWMSLVALDRAKMGIAQTLISLTPVFILPLVVWVYHERVSLRAILGACVAVAGTALLFLPQSR